MCHVQKLGLVPCTNYMFPYAKNRIGTKFDNALKDGFV